MSKIKDLNSNCAEYNINLYLGYLKTNIKHDFFCLQGTSEMITQSCLLTKQAGASTLH